MKPSAEYRAEAREALRGKWRTVIVAGFVAILFGVGSANTFNSATRFRNNYTMHDIRAFLQSDAWVQMRPAVLTVAGILLLWSLAQFVLGGAVELGYARFNLRLHDREDAETNELFSQFDRLGQGFLMRLLRDIYLLLWTLLLIIPGIMMSYAYAMTPYILYEHPEMTANEAIKASGRMMDGKKWNLFCLFFSFIGWQMLCDAPIWIAAVAFARRFQFSQMGIAEFLCTLVWLIPLLCLLGAGNLALTPYRQAAEAAFYRDLKRVAEQEQAQEQAPETENAEEKAE